MFEIVTTKEQQKQFAETWEYFCGKYNWYNDPYAQNGIRYNLLLPSNKKQVIGTMEFIPYDPKNPDSTVEGRFQFTDFQDIMEHQHKVWEADKVCLHKDFHRLGYFQLSMQVFYDHVKNNQPKYYIALMEKKFYRMMRISFGLAIEQRGGAHVCDTTELIPVVFDVDKIMMDEVKVKKLLKMAEAARPLKKKRIQKYIIFKLKKYMPIQLKRYVLKFYNIK